MKKGFLVGIILGIICVFSIAYATGYAVGNAAGIRSAEYNDTSVFFNGEEIDLGDRRLISVIPEGETYMTNYMPVRAVLESLGYGVVWNWGRISVFTEEYLINSDEWIDYEEFLERLIAVRYSPTNVHAHFDTDFTHYFEYEESSRRIIFTFRDSANSRTVRLPISTAVIHDNENNERRIYLKKSEVNRCLNIMGIPGIDALTEDLHERLEEFLKNVVCWTEVIRRTGAVGFRFSGLGWYPSTHHFFAVVRENELGFGIAFNLDYRIFLIYYNNSFHGYIPSMDFAPGWGSYMRIEDINYYLKRFGFPKID